MIGTRFCIPALLAFLVAATGCGLGGHRATRTVSQTAAHVAGSTIDVETRNGRITIHRDSTLGEVQIEATIVGSDATPEGAEARAASITVAVERGEDGTLSVRPVFPDQPRTSEGCSFVIRIPDTGAVFAKTSNGGVSLVGLGGVATLLTSNGAIEVEDHQGSVDAQTSNGRIVCTGVAGAVKASTSNGRIELAEVSGGISAETSNGSIRAEQAEGTAEPVGLKTSNGSVWVALPASASGSYQIDTSNGSISVEGNRTAGQKGGKNSRTIALGEGPGGVIRTSNGSVTVVLR